MDKKEKNKATDRASVSAKPNYAHIARSSCPLCESKEVTTAHRDSHSKIDRYYLNCLHCDLTFVPGEFHLSAEQEKAIYDCHENNPHDLGYRKFLSRLATPLMTHLKPGSAGLDFGCGPGPTLSLMLREEGYDMSEYDLYYAPDTHVLEKSYDFVTSTEVIEHLSKPKQVFEALFNLLNAHGILGLMTKRTPAKGVEGWHYTKDPTHITFYSDKTMNYLAKRFDCELKLISADTALLLKRS